MAGMDHGAGHDDRMPEGGQCERGPGMPSEHGTGMSCLFVAHCVAPMIAVERSAALPGPAASTSHVASPQSAPAAYQRAQAARLQEQPAEAAGTIAVLEE